MPRGKLDPDWKSIVEGWKKTQAVIRAKLVVEPLGELPRFVVGADAAFSEDKQKVLATAVVYDRIEQRIVEVAHAIRDIEFPYVPGFLSFREGPAVLAAVRELKHPWGMVCFDGQGIAHPRRCGLAAHMSAVLDQPGVGIAKSRLIGTYTEPGPRRGDASPLMDEKEKIGLVLRTRENCKPLFVSIGHRMDLPSAKRLALACLTKYRIPEPTRQADIEVAKLKSSLG